MTVNRNIRSGLPFADQSDQSGRSATRVVFFLAIAVFLAVTATAAATEFTETNKLTPQTLTDHFALYGEEVAVSSTFRVTSAPQHPDSDGVPTGAVYCCGLDGGSAYFADDGELFDEFGSSVAASESWVVVGARGDDDNGDEAGSAYVFEADGAGGLMQSAKLLASDGAPGDNFGGFGHAGASGVAVSGNRIVVGAHLDDHTDNFDKGSAYVFELDGAAGDWVETAKLIASDADAQDLFGWSVAVSGDRIVVGAPADDDNGLNSGSAYVFQPDGAGVWTQTAKLLADDPDPFNPSDRFGGSVAVSGDRIVVGAPSDDDSGSQAGAAYVFESDGRGGWTQTAKLLASDGADEDQFGWSVNASGNRVVVGMRVSGSAYVYESDGVGWVETRLVASDGVPGDGFGESVSVHGDVIVVGAVGAEPAGATYIYQAVTGAEDVTPPVLTVPDDITVEASSPSGAVVTFTATAIDDTDPNPIVVCNPASGSLFPIGDTTVTCTATDASGNSSSDTFLVTVIVGPSTFDGFIDQVEILDLSNGIEESLVKKIEAAKQQFIDGDLEDAAETLQSLIDQVDALEDNKLTIEAAAQIRSAAQTLIDAIV